MDIKDILKKVGVEIPEEKIGDFEKDFRENWKSKKELEDKTNKIANLEAEIQTKEEIIKTANAEIESYKTLDIETIKKNADEYKEKYETAEKTHKEEMAKRDYNDKVKEALLNSGLEFSSDYAKKGVLEELLSKELKLENNKLLGFDDALNEIKSTQPRAFVVKEEKKDDTPPPMYVGAGKDPITPTEADTIKQSFTRARENKNTTEMARLTRVAQEKGVKLD